MEILPPDGDNVNNNPITEISFDERVDHVLRHGYLFKLGKYIADGNAIIVKNIWGFMGFAFIYLVIALALSIIPAIGQFVGLIVTPSLTAGIYLVAFRIAKGKKEEFRNFFDGFKFVLPLSMLYILMLLIMSTIAILYIKPVIGKEGMEMLDQIVLRIQNRQINPADINYLMAVISRLIPLFIIIMVLTILFSFSVFIVLFGKKAPWNALLISGNIIGRKFIQFLILFIVIGLINILGCLPFFTGLFYTIPLSCCIMYAAYEDIVGTNGNEIPE